MHASAAKTKINYVITIVVSEDARNVVLLLNNKGPAHLIGKWTFPGGKDDHPGDLSPAHAAPRELFEESGVKVDASKFTLVRRTEADYGSLSLFFARTDISHARTMETEIIQVANLDKVVQEVLNEAGAAHDDRKYTEDFMEHLRHAGLFLPRMPEDVSRASQ